MLPLLKRCERSCGSRSEEVPALMTLACQLQEDGPDTEEGLMLLCDGCNKGMHMRCPPHPVLAQCMDDYCWLVCQWAKRMLQTCLCPSFKVYEAAA